MNRRFYNYTCSIYTFGQVVERGTIVQGKVVKYQNIKCALWKNTRSYGETPLAVQTDVNNYEINLHPSYPVLQGDIVSTKIGEFKIDQVIEHHDHRGRLENIQLFISSTT